VKKLPHVRNAIYGQPWAITEPWLDSICEIFESHMAGNSTEAAAQFAQQIQKELYQVVNGVAVIPVMGPLFPHANLMTKMSGATSYDAIREAFSDALDRDDVAAIVLKTDSPGGSVSGSFELATEIYECRKGSSKPILGHVEGQGASAAYLLLSQCDMVTCTEASLAGSIGVIARLGNTDRMEKNMGNDSVVIRSKELKAPGGGGPITPNQIQSMQKTVMRFDGMFQEFVKRGRPGINLDKAATGEEWVGQDAVDMGLCDSVATMDDLISEYGVHKLI
jgi:ClpP class serine protease